MKNFKSYIFDENTEVLIYKRKFEKGKIGVAVRFYTTHKHLSNLELYAKDEEEQQKIYDKFSEHNTKVILVTQIENHLAILKMVEENNETD